MGGRDKGLLPLSGRPMVDYLIEALRPQTDEILINANRNQAAYARPGCTVIPDITGGYLGPLAGIAGAMREARCPWIVTAPCDSPLLPANLVEGLYAPLAEEDADIAVAHDGARMQPVFALMRCDLLPDLLAFLNQGGRKVDAWYARHRTVLGDFSSRNEAFLNVNTPEERTALEKALQLRGSGDKHAAGTTSPGP